MVSVPVMSAANAPVLARIKSKATSFIRCMACSIGDGAGWLLGRIEPPRVEPDDDGTVNVYNTQPISITAASKQLPDVPGYALTDCIGKGGYGEVWKGVQLHTQQ